MALRLIDRVVPPPVPTAPARPRKASADPGYEALPRLTRLRADLAAVPPPARRRWKVAPLFFFDARRQAELAAARPTPVHADLLAEVATCVAGELPLLFNSVELRRVARGIDGLQAAAEAIADRCPAAKTLAELLAVPDDEVVLVLHPGLRAGFRLAVRGVADVGQFHLLMADAVAGDRADGLLPGPNVPDRFLSAYRDVNPTAPAGVPMVAQARFQMYVPAALRPNGTLPTGFGGCESWLWPTAPLAAVPRIDGERVAIVGPPAYRATWDIDRRFPAMPAGVQLLEVLSPFRVVERLSRLTGHPVSPSSHAESAPGPALSKAA